MVQDVVTLPLRIGAGVARLGLHVAGRAFSAGVEAAERLVEVVVPPPGEPQAPADVTEPARADTEATEPQPEPEPPKPADAPTASPAADTRPAAAPAHVSEEPQLVQESADLGAEDGAGAEVRIEEPWAGYGRLAANEVIARLDRASREELAAIALYERAHRGRKTVLAAADRQLQRATSAPRHST